MPYISSGKVLVEFDVVLTESVSSGGKVTSSPIEGNKTISDHFAANQNVLSITGVCTKNAANKIANLSMLFSSGAICSYVGRNGMYSVVITKLDTNHGSEVSAAFSFSISMTAVKISTTQEFTYATGLTNGQNAAQVKPTTNVGVASPTTRVVDSVTQQNANNQALAVANLTR